MSLLDGKSLIKFCDGLKALGVDARIINPSHNRISINSSPITGIRIKVQTDEYTPNDYYVIYEVNDARQGIGQPPAEIPKARSKVIKTFPRFGKPINVIWRGRQVLPGITDNDKLKLDLLRWQTKGDVALSFTPELFCWDIVQGEGLSPPESDLWKLYEGIAHKLLQIPLAKFSELGLKSDQMNVELETVQGSAGDLASVDTANVLRHLKSRSWLWWHSNPGVRKRALERLTALTRRINGTVAKLANSGYFDEHTVPKCVFVTGSFPWVDDPSDIDLIVVVEGEHNLEYFSAEALEPQEFGLNELPPVSLAIVGLDTMLNARSGRKVPHERRVALMYTMLYGAALLAGDEMFSDVSLSKRDFQALARDLELNRKRAYWPELVGDAKKIDSKENWRDSEMLALRGRSDRRALGFLWHRKSGW